MLPSQVYLGRKKDLEYIKKQHGINCNLWYYDNFLMILPGETFSIWRYNLRRAKDNRYTLKKNVL